jgi:hypothetical protein
VLERRGDAVVHLGARRAEVLVRRLARQRAPAMRSRPAVATWSRHGEIARMPLVAHSSTMRSSGHCARTVAVLIDSQRWS